MPATNSPGACSKPSTPCCSICSRRWPQGLRRSTPPAGAGSSQGEVGRPLQGVPRGCGAQRRDRSHARRSSVLGINPERHGLQPRHDREDCKAPQASGLRGVVETQNNYRRRDHRRRMASARNVPKRDVLPDGLCASLEQPSPLDDGLPGGRAPQGGAGMAGNSSRWAKAFRSAADGFAAEHAASSIASMRPFSQTVLGSAGGWNWTI
jgi:hypothetical protein